MIQPIGTSLTPGGLGQTSLASDRFNGQPQPTPPEAGARENSAEPLPLVGHGTNTPDSQGIAEPKSSLEKALESVNDSLKAWSTGMRFDVDKDAQRLVISIVDNSDGKVLRTIPSDAVLRVAKMIVKLQGAGVDTHA